MSFFVSPVNFPIISMVIFPTKYMVLYLNFPDFAPCFVLNGQIFLSTIGYSDDSVV
jgi:hypothetical protein